MRSRLHRCGDAASMLRISVHPRWGKQAMCQWSYRRSNTALLSNNGLSAPRWHCGEQRCQKSHTRPALCSRSDGSWRHGIKRE